MISFSPTDSDSVKRREQTAKIEVGKMVRSILRKKGASGQSLRIAIYTDLYLNHGVKFPKSSESWKSEMLLRKSINQDFSYQGKDVAYLLREFLEDTDSTLNATGNVSVIKNLLSGLNVTTTSFLL